MKKIGFCTFVFFVITMQVIAKKSDSLRIALFLPFNASSLEVLSLVDKKSFSNAELALDFYMGVKFALKQYEHQGKKIILDVYDSENDSFQLKKIILSSKFPIPDLVIGPVYPQLFSAMNSWSRFYSVPIISPISPVSLDKFRNPNYIMMAPPLEEYGKLLAHFVVQQPGKKKIISLATNDVTDIRLTKSFIQRVDSLQKNTKVIELNPLQTGFGAVERALSHTDTNYLLVPYSTNESLSVILSEVKRLALTYPIITLGHPTLEKNTTIDLALFEKVNLHFPSNNYEDDFFANDTLVANFRELYATDPGSFGVKGFQITSYFVDLYFKNKLNPISKIAEGKANNFMFNFTRNKSGIIVNQKLRVFKVTPQGLISINDF